MKICKYCNIVNDDSAANCSSCGGNSFEYKCENCGSVFDKGLHCPHCGVKVGQSARLCPVCKTEYYSNACPTCGYVPGKAASGAPAAVYSMPQPVPPKRRTWLWVLGWIFIFPLPLTLILLKKQDMDKKIRYGIIAAAWVAYLLIGVFGRSGNDKANMPNADGARKTYTATEAVTEKVTEVATEEPTIALTEAPTEAPTKAPTEAPTKAPTEAPTKAPTEALISIVFIDYSSSVEAGSIAHVKIQGQPNTEYSISVYYSSTESNAKGLGRKTTDNNGYVTWEWKVGPNTTKGEHSITVRGGGVSESVKFTVY